MILICISFVICHWLYRFLQLKKHLEPYTVQNAEILNLSNYQNFTKKGKPEVCAFGVMLLIVIQALLQYCETLKAS